MRPELANLGALPVLTTECTTLRAIELDDAGGLHDVFSDPETMRYWSSTPHADGRATRGMIASIQASFDDRTALQWAVERTADHRVLGTVTLLPERDQPRAELGYILGREHWRRGYAGEAQRRVVRFAFEELAMHRLEADTHPGNRASSRSLERLGFQPEGLMRERWLVDGEYSDSMIWGLLRSDWDRDGAA